MGIDRPSISSSGGIDAYGFGGKPIYKWYSIDIFIDILYLIGDVYDMFIDFDEMLISHVY